MLTLCAACSSAAAQSNEWTWIGGSSTIGSNGGQPGVYGTLGTPAAGNIPGVRESAMSWTDHSGNLWIFGGWGLDSTGTAGYLNDLWEYNPTANEWAWMGGSSTVGSNDGQSGVYATLGTPAAGNIPGGRYSAVTWTDTSGNLWLFGGRAIDSAGFVGGHTNDLWKFNPASNEWTWMGGSNIVYQVGTYGTLGSPAPGNVPGARDWASSWTDNKGNFWLFGGDGFDSTRNFSQLNDLWEYNPTTNEWAWMSGSSTGGQPGVYGTLGTPAAGNVPGARYSASSWTDSSGNLWLFGGFANLNDLWEFLPIANEWAWMGGSSTGGQAGVYGTVGTPAAGNTPGGRYSAVSWTDSGGNFWLFGGIGAGSIGSNGLLNDLWEDNPAANEWAWIGGSSTAGQSGVYGILGTPAAENTPGGRYIGANWTDHSGNLWLFGGYGFDSDGNVGDLNDLWKYQLPTPALASGFTLQDSPSALTIPPGASATTTITINDIAGFNGGLALSASGLPSGVTAAFSSNPASGSSVLTLTASSTAAPGTHTVIVTGSSGSFTEFTSLTLTIAAATQASGSGAKCAVHYAIEPQNSSAFGVTITIGNTGNTSLNNWTLSWAFANGQKITELWDGSETQSGANVTVKNASYNGSIPAGSSYTGVGFNATWNGVTNAAPASFTLSGTVCTLD